MAFQRVKQFKDLELSYDAPSGMTVKFYTDMPGTSSGTNGAQALACTVNFPATTGRQTFTMPLDAGSSASSAAQNYIEGTLYKVLITSTGVVRLFGGVVRCRAIGTWFNGANAESWNSQEQGVGI